MTCGKIQQKPEINIFSVSDPQINRSFYEHIFTDFGSHDFGSQSATIDLGNPLDGKHGRLNFFRGKAESFDREPRSELNGCDSFHPSF